MQLLELSRRIFSREFQVYGSSMDPLIPPGSHVRIRPLIWGIPQRNDIVAVRAPDSPGRIEIKRIIGLPGERVSWMGPDIWINDIPLPEPYITHHATTPGEDRESLVLGAGEFFVAGDNRLYSQDSRSYGAVEMGDILGTLLA